ncbi:Crp/Fnr family transcriptional regulator [Mucilaginibacter flavus]|uniref:Crp/Fnr family transcriptional regulator n=1 Tax=Mucilaginibacter flavus TaxID=931504 RepID=UPI0025B5BAD3|nr:Crp/Fnr family transcriptional regulator [Mucilaginibacter flavus]MDN3582161.1 Crp/Fnr family transcriptional regulator [Mucilaginibacter flavus]
MFDVILANFAMHISLNAAETAHVKSLLQHKAVKKNTVLLHSGDICRNIYFVNKGCLRIFNTDSNGEEHNISFCPENWWAVDISSFSGQSPAFYAIGTLEDTDVFYLSYSMLEQLYVDVPKFERFFRILTQNGFNLYQRRITSNLSKTAEERYLQFQKQYPKLEQRIAQKQIASYLGITPVFLSMIRGKKS